ncbi:MAG: hypothetical protein IPG50_17760 [Myxococcales bacterium]|nr:hypothetical protein [Myxococcales bacterium]
MDKAVTFAIATMLSFALACGEAPTPPAAAPTGAPAAPGAAPAAPAAPAAAPAAPKPGGGW